MHRAYFIGYHDGGVSLVAASRHPEGLEDWVFAQTGIRGIDVPGVYGMNAGSWTLRQPITVTAANRIVTGRAEMSAKGEGREALLDVLLAAPEGLPYGRAIKAWTGLVKGGSVRMGQRHMAALLSEGVVFRHSGKGRQMIYQVVTQTPGGIGPV
jgi:hypothetical protein